MRFSSAIVLAVITTLASSISAIPLTSDTDSADHCAKACIFDSQCGSNSCTFNECTYFVCTWMLDRWDVRGHMNTIKGANQSTAQPHTVGVWTSRKWEVCVRSVQTPRLAPGLCQVFVSVTRELPGDFPVVPESRQAEGTLLNRFVREWLQVDYAIEIERECRDVSRDHQYYAFTSSISAMPVDAAGTGTCPAYCNIDPDCHICGKDQCNFFFVCSLTNALSGQASVEFVQSSVDWQISFGLILFKIVSFIKV
ncbi:hypothetical protein C8R48DRAFT_758945 [Suillus tomentosus]|nr:hypothetical protein C8R48DRAFT_758945 [Suillus tomentosus]